MDSIEILDLRSLIPYFYLFFADYILPYSINYKIWNNSSLDLAKEINQQKIYSLN